MSEIRLQRWQWLEGLLVVALCLLIIQIVYPFYSTWHNRPRSGKQVVQRFSSGTMSLRYLVYLPENYFASRGDWPLVLFLHGAGERGRNIELVKKLGPPHLIVDGTSYPFILVSPQCPPRTTWDTQLLIALLDELRREFSIDPSRVYITGFSMGAYGACRLAAADPTRFAALVPLSGGVEPALAAELAQIPIWAFHGDKDKVVSPEITHKMVDAVRGAGGTARLTIYPDEGHDICNTTYSDPKLYEWLLRQRRPAVALK